MQRRFQSAITNIPSQKPARQPAFDPRDAVDLLGTPALQEKHGDGQPPSDSYVVSVFDSRPIGEIDFNISQLVSPSGDPEAPAGSITLRYNVPFGYVGILRDFHVETVPGVGFITPNPISVKVNGNNVDQNSPLNISRSSTRVMDFETFIIIPEGGELMFQILAPTSTYQLFIQAHGNLLLSTGRALIAEPGTAVPVPTIQKSELR